MNAKSKVAVIGAGFVGSSTAYALALRQVCSELALIDVAADKASGEVDDIRHGLPYLGHMDIYSGGYECVKDADLIIITAGANRKPGETRLNLAKKNIAIARSITDEIMKHYNGGVILVVSNPVDILTYMFTKWMGLPEGMVSLDTVRFRSAIADLTHVDVINIHGYIIGEHGDSQVPAWSNTHIAGIQVDDYCRMTNITFDEKVKAGILEHVKTDGASIIKRKGATYYGVSISIAMLANSILRGSNTIRVVSSVLDGQFGVSDVALSLPTVIGKYGAQNVLTPILTESEIEAFIKSAEACKAVLNDCI
jgi:L-lactate dehydrogenase